MGWTRIRIGFFKRIREAKSIKKFVKISHFYHFYQITQFINILFFHSKYFWLTTDFLNKYNHLWPSSKCTLNQIYWIYIGSGSGLFQKEIRKSENDPTVIAAGWAPCLKVLSEVRITVIMQGMTWAMYGTALMPSDLKMKLMACTTCRKIDRKIDK